MESWEKKVIEDGIYSVKKVQYFASPDGGGLNCDLYKDGKLFLHVHDGGYGGCFCYDMTAADIGHYKRTKENRFNSKWVVLEKYVSSMPTMAPCDLFPEGREVSVDEVVDFLASRAYEIKRIKRAMKRNIFYLDSDDKVYSVKFKVDVTARHRIHVIQEYMPKKVFDTPESVVDHM